MICRVDEVCLHNPTKTSFNIRQRVPGLYRWELFLDAWQMVRSHCPSLSSFRCPVELWTWHFTVPTSRIITLASGECRWRKTMSLSWFLLQYTRPRWVTARSPVKHRRNNFFSKRFTLSIASMTGFHRAFLFNWNELSRSSVDNWSNSAQFHTDVGNS